MKDSIFTFFRFVTDRMYRNSDEDEIRTSHVKQMIEENESYKAEIVSLIDQMDKMVIDYNDKVQEYESEKQLFDTQVKNAYQSANLQKIQIQ